jgi:hypothetical protein
VGEDRLLISEAASKALFNLLSNGGSLRSRTIDQVHERLIEVDNRLWEGGKVSSFVDNQGGGWLIDISRGFNDMMLYAVVRSVDGSRAVVNVIDEAELAAMKDGGSPPEPTAEEPEPVSRGATKRPPFQAPTEPPPESPALLRWVDRGPEPGDPERGMGKAGNGESWEALDLPYKDVRSKVQELISEGIDPADIEIWTQRKKPQVSVVLV